MKLSKLVDLNDTSLLLQELHKALVTHEITIPEAATIMEEKCRNTLLLYIQKGETQPLANFSEKEKQDIFMLIEIAQYIFNYSGESTGMSDTEYDKLYSIYESFNMGDVITVPLPTNITNKASHKYPVLRGTLSKIHHLDDDEISINPNRQYLSSWVKMREKLYETNTGEKIDLMEEYVYVFPKWDGVSCVFEFNPDGSLSKALTRGDVDENIAQDVTILFRGMQGKKTENGYGLQTEIIMEKSKLDHWNKEHGTNYKSTRSIVSSILNSNNPDERTDLLVIKKLREVYTQDSLEEIAEEALSGTDFLYIQLKRIDLIREFSAKVRDPEFPFPCDGVVIYFHNEKVRNVLGRNSDRPLYSVAYKFTEDVKLTKLESVSFTMGMTGRLIPIAHVEPVEMFGNTITKISLGSVSRLQSMELRIGDTVKVICEIIPYLIFDSDCKHKKKGIAVEIPTTCPFCNTHLVESASGVFDQCDNKDCDVKKIARIVNYLVCMGIPNISIQTIEDLYKNGIVKNILDLYSLSSKKRDLLKLDGYGETRVNQIIESIMSVREIPDFKLMAALGINGASIATFREICSIFTLREIISLSIERDVEAFCDIKGIKEKKAKKIMDGVMEHRLTLLKLMTILKISHPCKEDGKFSVCFSKIKDPSSLEKKIKELGGVIHDKIQKTTTYLVVPDLKVGSKKIEYAMENNIRIVPMDKIILVIEKNH